MHKKSSSIDGSKALNFAIAQNEFVEKVHGYNYTYLAISPGWTFDSHCKTSLKGVDVEFAVYGEKGYVKNIIVTEDPTLTKVVNIVEEVGNKHSTSNNNNIWSGYEFSANAQASIPVYEAYGSWTTPTVSVPSSGGSCSTPHCDLAVWVGLEDQLGAGDSDLVQAGTDESKNCGVTGCPVTYEAWYEFLPSADVHLTMVSLGANHAITTQVTNEAQYGGFTTLYDVSVVDSTSSTSQSVTGTSYTRMPGPVDGDFMIERSLQTDIGQTQTLAAYSPTGLSITGKTWYSSAFHGITTPYTSGWYNTAIMNLNCPTNPNISIGTVSTSSVFTETYLNSCGT
jgi:hypothetical protein